MATQGLVSVTKDGTVIIKAVCGCNGQAAPKLAEAIKALDEITAPAVYDAALSCGFGCPTCLVVSERIGDLYVRHQCNGDDLPEEYLTKFDDPRFNPRWGRGTASCTAVVEL